MDTKLTQIHTTGMSVGCEQGDRRSEGDLIRLREFCSMSIGLPMVPQQLKAALDPAHFAYMRWCCGVLGIVASLSSTVRRSRGCVSSGWSVVANGILDATWRGRRMADILPKCGLLAPSVRLPYKFYPCSVARLRPAHELE
jgi:hypothetical protein